MSSSEANSLCGRLSERSSLQVIGYVVGRKPVLPRRGEKARGRAGIWWPGPLMASVPYQLVGEMDDARAKRFRIHKLQRLLISPLLKEALPSAQDDRMDHKTKFVEEVLTQQPPNEGAAAHETDVLARLLLEPGDFHCDIFLDQRRVLPLKRLIESSRDDVLGGVVQVVRVWLLGSILVRPESSELFVGGPSQQHCV